MPMKRVCEDRFYLTTHYTNGERDSILKDDVWSVTGQSDGLYIEKRDETVIVLHGLAASRFLGWWFRVYVSKLNG